MPQVDETISTVEAADILGGSRPWIYKLIERGELEAIRIGRDWRVTKESLERYKAKLADGRNGPRGKRK